MRMKKLRRFLDRHLHYVADRFLVVEDFERLRIVSATAAVFARHQRLRQKIHFQFDHALAVAGFASTALGVERKTAGRVTAHARNRQLRVKISNLVENFDVSPRSRSRRLANRRLIDFVNRFDLFRAADQFK